MLLIQFVVLMRIRFSRFVFEGIKKTLIDYSLKTSNLM